MSGQQEILNTDDETTDDEVNILENISPQGPDFGSNISDIEPGSDYDSDETASLYGTRNPSDFDDTFSETDEEEAHARSFGLNPPSENELSTDSEQGDQLASPSPGVILERSHGVMAVAASDNGNRFVTGSTDGYIELWEKDGIQWVGPDTFYFHQAGVKTIAMSGNGNVFVSGSWDTTIRVFEKTDSGWQFTQTLISDYNVYQCAISQDGNTIISSDDEDHKIKIWTRWDDSEEYEQTSELTQDDGNVSAIAISNDGNMIISGYDNNKVYMWLKAVNGFQPYFLGEHGGYAYTVSISNDKNTIVIGYGERYDGSVKVWEKINNAWNATTLHNADSVVVSVDISNDGKIITSGHYNGRVNVWVNTGNSWNNNQQLHTTSFNHDDIVNSVVITNSRNTLISGSSDKTIRVLDISNFSSDSPDSGTPAEHQQMSVEPRQTRSMTRATDGARQSQAFLTAVENNDINKVRTMLANGIDVNTLTQNGSSALIISSDEGHTDMVRLLLQQPTIDVNVISNNGYIALPIAISDTRIDIINMLLDRDDIDVNARGENGKTALHHASWHGLTDIAQKLLSKGANIHTKDNDGKTALDIANDRHHYEIVELLENAEEERLASIHTISDPEQLMELFINAIKSEDSGFISSVLFNESINFDIDATYHNGMTPLMYASKFIIEDTNIVIMLIEAGADISIKDNDGKTALDHASEPEHERSDKTINKISGTLKTANEFIDHAKTGNRDGLEKSLTSGVFERGVFERVVSDGKTALMHAAENGHKNIVEFLIELHANVSIEMKDGGKIAEDLANDNNHDDIVKILRKYRLFDIENSDYINMIDTLLTEGVDINILDHDKRTAFMKALLYHNYHIAHMLFDRGADINIQNFEDVSPLDIVIDNLYEDDGSVNNTVRNLKHKMLASGKLHVSELQKSEDAFENYNHQRQAEESGGTEIEIDDTAPLIPQIPRYIPDNIYIKFTSDENTAGIDWGGLHRVLYNNLGLEISDNYFNENGFFSHNADEHYATIGKMMHRVFTHDYNVNPTLNFNINPLVWLHLIYDDDDVYNYTESKTGEREYTYLNHELFTLLLTPASVESACREEGLNKYYRLTSSTTIYDYLYGREVDISDTSFKDATIIRDLKEKINTKLHDLLSSTVFAELMSNDSFKTSDGIIDIENEDVQTVMQSNSDETKIDTHFEKYKSTMSTHEKRIMEMRTRQNSLTKYQKIKMIMQRDYANMEGVPPPDNREEMYQVHARVFAYYKQLITSDQRFIILKEHFNRSFTIYDDTYISFRNFNPFDLRTTLHGSDYDLEHMLRNKTVFRGFNDEEKENLISLLIRFSNGQFTDAEKEDFVAVTGIENPTADVLGKTFRSLLIVFVTGSTYTPRNIIKTIRKMTPPPKQPRERVYPPKDYKPFLAHTCFNELEFDVIYGGPRIITAIVATDMGFAGGADHHVIPFDAL